MPVELQVIRASEFVCLDAHEHLDFEASQNALQALAHACRKRGLNRAVLDLRTVPVPDKPQFTPTELAALVRTFQQAGFSRRERLAVLYALDVHGGVQTFAFFGRMRGLHVQAFTEYEAALNWLSELPETQVESSQGEVSIPIAKRQRQIKKLTVGAPPPRASSTAHRSVRRIT
jgi:hypothetical protein